MLNVTAPVSRLTALAFRSMSVAIVVRSTPLITISSLPATEIPPAAVITASMSSCPPGVNAAEPPPVTTPVVVSTVPTTNPSRSARVRLLAASAIATATVSKSLARPRLTASSTSTRRPETVIVEPAVCVSPASDNSDRLVTPAGLNAAVTVIAPASDAPIRSVVAVIVSSSASPSSSVAAVSSAASPRSIAIADVSATSVTVLAPTFTVPPASAMSSARSVAALPLIAALLSSS